MQYYTPQYMPTTLNAANMVAEGSDTSRIQHYTPTRQTFSVTEKLPQLPPWKVRDGRTNAFAKWHDALINIENDLDIDPNEQQPSFEPIAMRYSEADNVMQIMDMTAAAAEQWQADSNMLFDIIKTSLVLDGPHLQRDLRKIGTFTNGKLKDARALRAWALSFADCSSIDRQIAIRTTLHNTKLTEGASYTMLEMHCRFDLSVWGNVIGNDLDNRESLEKTIQRHSKLDKTQKS